MRQAFLFVFSLLIAVAGACPTFASNDSASQGWLAWRGWSGHAYLGIQGSRSGDDLADPLLNGATQIGLSFRMWQRLDLNFGVGSSLGRFLWLEPKAENPYFQRRRNQFSHGMDRLYLRLPFEFLHWQSEILAGYFRYATHGDGGAFGEYLLRYGSYPAHVDRPRPSWDALGEKTVPMRGIALRTASPAKHWQHDWLLLADSSYYRRPFDLSAAWVVKASPWPGIEWGGGLGVFHYPWHEANTIETGRTNRYYLPLSPLPSPFDSINVPDTAFTSDKVYYGQYRVIQAMLRFAWNPSPWLGLKSWHESDWRFYGEAVLLGWNDYPLLYEKRHERILAMLGMNLPSFGLLNRLDVQWEAMNSVHPFTRQGRLSSSVSVLATKSLWPWLSLQAQWVNTPIATFSMGPLYLSQVYLNEVPERPARENKVSVRVQADF